MNFLAPSVFSKHPAYGCLRGHGAGRIDIEKIFDAFGGHPPAPSSIDVKMADLRALGFADPVKMVTSSPAILGLAIENIRTKLHDLRALGFADPVKMVTTLPAILGYAIENIRTKLHDLRALGFADPVKMVTSSPAILGLAIENIRTKLHDLRALGFADPVKMVTTLPAILGLAIENIRTKLRCAQHLKFAPHDLVSQWPTVLSYSLKRVLFVVRVLHGIEGANVATFQTLLTMSPDIVAAASLTADGAAVKALRQAITRQKKAGAANTQIIRSHPASKVILAYCRYRGVPTPAQRGVP